MNVHPQIVPSLVDRIKQTLVALKMSRAIEILDVILRCYTSGGWSSLSLAPAARPIAPSSGRPSQRLDKNCAGIGYGFGRFGGERIKRKGAEVRLMQTFSIFYFAPGLFSSPWTSALFSIVADWAEVKAACQRRS